MVPGYNERTLGAVMGEWEKRHASLRRDIAIRHMHVGELEAEVKAILNHLKFLTSETATRYMEEDLIRIEAEIAAIKDDTESAE